jgi:hypothetical protein
MKPFSRRTRTSGRLVAFVVTLTLLIGLALVMDWWPMLRGGFGWRWPYVKPTLEQLKRILPLLLTVLVYLAGIYYLRRARAWLYVAWSVLGATAISLAALYWLGDPLYLLFTRTVSGLTTGGFTVASRTEDLMGTLRQWPDLMPAFEKFSSHMAVSPPGWAAAYYLVGQGLEKLPFLNRPLAMMIKPLLCNNIPLMQLSNAQLASAWLGIAAPFWAALAAIPTYDLGRRMAGDKVGRLAIAWWPLVPSLVMFMGTLSTPYALGSVCVFWLFWVGFERRGPGGLSWLLMAAGALTGFLLLFSLAWVPYLLFLGLFALLYGQRFGQKLDYPRLRRSLAVGIQFGIGLIVILFLYTVLTGHTPYSFFQSAMRYHVQLDRAYWPWLLLHTWDYALFLGLPAFLLALIGCFRATGPIRTLAISLTLTLIFTVLSGSGRGETGRIWLFFMPFALLVAAQVVYQVDSKQRPILLASQIAWLFVLLISLRTVGTGYSPPPTLAAVAFQTAEQPTVVGEVDFGGLLRLQGFSEQIDPATPAIVVDLYWRLQEPLDTPYFFSVVLVSPEGAPVSAADWQPFDYQFPTTCWYAAVGQGQIVDRIVLPVAAVAESGDYWLSLRVFELREDNQPEFLPVMHPDGRVDDQVGLGPIPAAPPEPQ